MTEKYYECFVCGKKELAEPKPLGWELSVEDFLVPFRKRSYCPKHRQRQPKALVTLGDFVKK